MSTTKLLVAALALGLSFTQCAPQTSTDRTISIKDGVFVDANNRQVIFNGINHVHKVPDDNFLNAKDSSIFKLYERSGFNFVRFGIYWRSIEPKPGVYDELFLKELDRRVKWASDCGLWLMIDLHQDLWINAAPQWAVLNQGQPHITGNSWSDAYMISPAVQVALDNFWANKPASDSIGILDRYTAMLGMLAARYKSSPSVVGYDLMNEPFPGSVALKIMPAMMAAHAKLLGDSMTPEQVRQMWGDPQARVRVLEDLSNKTIFAKLTESIAPLVDSFEQGTLSKFYQQSRDAIRRAGSKQILFLEHSYFCNIGVKSTFIVPRDEQGATDKLCAYAPHAYDLTTDTHNDDKQSTGRVDFIFDQITRSATERSLPVVIGEWGAFYGGASDYLAPAQHVIGLIEKGQMGQSYWSYWDKVEQNNYYKEGLTRIYPAATNGKLTSYANNFAQSAFSMSWRDGSSNAPTLVYLPVYDAEPKISITPQSDYRIEGRYLSIDPIQGTDRLLTINR